VERGETSRRRGGRVVSIVNPDEVRFWGTRQRRPVSSSRFNRSVCPLDWGWYPEDRLTVAPQRAGDKQPAGGQPSGTDMSAAACLTLSSMSYGPAPTRQDVGRMHEGGLGGATGSNSQDRETGFMFFEAG